MYIFLDSEEVCVRLENGLSMRMDLAIVSLNRNYLIANAFRNIPWRTNMASIKWGYYKAFKVKSLLGGKDHWMTAGSAITHCTNLNLM